MMIDRAAGVKRTQKTSDLYALRIENNLIIESNNVKIRNVMQYFFALL